MPLHFCLLLLVLLLAGCDRRSASVPLVSAEDGLPVMTERQYGRSNPLIIDTFLPAPCRLVRSKTVAPSDYERAEFDRRLQEAKELSPHAVGVESAIDIGCILRRYPSADLSVWAARGDPVAMYGDLANRYRRLGDVCRHDAVIAAGLEKAYNTQFVTVDGVRISRLPELYYLIGSVKLDCGRKGATKYLSSTYDRGYFPPEPIM
jgi:hypothetical protein